jgi:hypothetical protein
MPQVLSKTEDIVEPTCEVMPITRAEKKAEARHVARWQNALIFGCSVHIIPTREHPSGLGCADFGDPWRRHTGRRAALP